MVMSNGLSHVAMSVAEGTLTDEYRTELLGFYGDYFGWSEMEAVTSPGSAHARRRARHVRQHP